MNFLNLIKIMKIIYLKPPTNYDIYWWKTGCSPPKIRNKTRTFALPTFIQHYVGCSSQSN